MGAAGVTAAPSRNGVATTSPASQLTHRRAARPAAGGCPRSRPARRTPARGAARDRRAGAGRAEQGVARGVLALDELHDVDAVALQPHQRGPQRVGQGVGQPLAQDAVPGEHGVRRGRRRPAELRGHVVVAAGRGEHQRRLPLDRAGQRLVGRGVAGVQGEHHLGRSGRARPRRSCRPRTSRPGRARRRPPRCARATARLTSTPVRWTGQPADVGEEALGGEGQVGVAAAQVDDPQRLLGCRRPQLALVDRLGDRGVEQPEELLDLAVLVLPARLHPAVGVAEPERAEQRVVLRQQPVLVAVVAAVDLGLLGAGGCARRASPLRVTRSWWVSVVVSTCQLPNGSSSRSSTASRRCVADRVVGRVRLRLVVRRDLEVPAGLEVDVPQLDPAPRRLGAALPPRRDGADQRLVVEEVGAHPGQRAQERFAHRRGPCGGASAASIIVG